jgi:hypothetical protein
VHRDAGDLVAAGLDLAGVRARPAPSSRLYETQLSDFLAFVSRH